MRRSKNIRRPRPKAKQQIVSRRGTLEALVRDFWGCFTHGTDHPLLADYPLRERRALLNEARPLHKIVHERDDYEQARHYDPERWSQYLKKHVLPLLETKPTQVKAKPKAKPKVNANSNVLTMKSEEKK